MVEMLKGKVRQQQPPLHPNEPLPAVLEKKESGDGQANENLDTTSQAVSGLLAGRRP